MWADWGPWHMWGGWWWVFPLLMMVFLVLCGLFMTGAFGVGRRRTDDAGSAIRVLNERFAKGEISREEFEERRTVLLAQP